MMFYVKIPLADGVTVQAGIHSDNVTTRCHCCGMEMPVDLAKVFSDGKGDLDSTELLCPECTKLLLERMRDR